MKRLRDALTLFILLMVGVPSALTAARLSLPSIPDFRLPSAGVVNTVFPAATGGAAPYTYGVSGLPPGISFSRSSRRASGTLPTVATETTYTVTYSVRDGAGASASVSFTATVVPPPAPPPPPPSLSLPTIPDFRLPSGGSVDTVFPAATGGRSPYSYNLTGLPAGISFSSFSRRARGTLPTVSVDTTYTITYSVRDSRGATASVTFTAVVTAPPSTTVRRSPPGPPPTRADPPDVPVSAVKVYRLPFTVSETGVSGEKSYRFELASSTKVSLSLTGMNRDIDCRVNASSCTNRSGTADDSWSGTLEAGKHTVTVYASGGGSGSWTLSVSGTAVSPPADPPPQDPPPTTTNSHTYVLSLSSNVEVSVELSGMTADFDCTVAGSPCTNRRGTLDDSWSGTLQTGDYEIVVYPHGGASGNYTLAVSTRPPDTGGRTETRTEVTTLVEASGTNVSTTQTYTFALEQAAKVDVALTGMTIDFDCRVSNRRCTNNRGIADDSWSGSLEAGGYWVAVSPYDTGPGNYSLAVTATETAETLVTPVGGPTGRICNKDKDGNKTCQIIYGDSIKVTAPRPPLPPAPPQPPTTTPTPPQPQPPGPSGGGGPTGPAPSGSSLAAATSDINCEGWNIDDGDGFDADRANQDGTTRKHRALDIQVSSADASFFALSDGTITSYASSATCGHQIAVRLPSGGRHVYCHMDEDDRLAAGTKVRAGDRIGSYGPSGATSGPHLHLKVTDSNDRPIDPVEAAGGESVMAAAGFTFNSSDAEHCAGG